MRLNQTLLRFGVVGALIAAASLPVQAAVITYTDRKAFLAALSSSSADNYDDLKEWSVAFGRWRHVRPWKRGATQKRSSRGEAIRYFGEIESRVS